MLSWSLACFLKVHFQSWKLKVLEKFSLEGGHLCSNLFVPKSGSWAGIANQRKRRWQDHHGVSLAFQKKNNCIMFWVELLTRYRYILIFLPPVWRKGNDVQRSSKRLWYSGTLYRIFESGMVSEQKKHKIWVIGSCLKQFFFGGGEAMYKSKVWKAILALLLDIKIQF